MIYLNYTNSWINTIKNLSVDGKITTNDDLREFKNLDTPNSEKQFILLVK